MWLRGLRSLVFYTETDVIIYNFKFSRVYRVHLLFCVRKWTVHRLVQTYTNIITVSHFTENKSKGTIYSAGIIRTLVMTCSGYMRRIISRWRLKNNSSCVECISLISTLKLYIIRLYMCETRKLLTRVPSYHILRRRDLCRGKWYK